MDAQARVLSDVAAERQRQLDEWGVQTHGLTVWLTILAEEVGESAQEALTYRQCTSLGDDMRAKLAVERLREELIQVAAVAVAAIEDVDSRYSPER